MKAKDSIDIWFKTLEEMGESSEIIIQTIDSSENKQVHRFDHGKFDAISGFIQNIGKVDNLKTSLKGRTDNTSALKYLYGFLRYIIRLPFYSAKWNKYKDNWRELNNLNYPQAVNHFTQEDTDLIKENAKKRKVSLNSFLLYNLDYCLADKFDNNSKRVWLIPVNMRSDYNENSHGNEVGFVDAVIKRNLNVNQLDDQIKNRIKNHEHLGGIVGVSIGVFIGEYLLKKLVRFNKYIQVRSGVFTNLGEWTSRGREDEKISGFPPVIETQPIGASALTWNGRLAIAIHAHPCLEFSDIELENILKKWVNFLKER